MDNRYNARYRNMDSRGAPGRRAYPENTGAPDGFQNDFRGNWYAGQQTMGRGTMENTRESMRQNPGNPYMRDMRRGPQPMQNMQTGPMRGQNIRQGGMQQGGMQQGGMQQGRYNMKQPGMMRQPQEPMGQIYNMQPPGGQMGQGYGRRPTPGGMGGPGGQPTQMRRNFMGPMGGSPTQGDMNR